MFSTGSSADRAFEPVLSKRKGTKSNFKVAFKLISLEKPSMNDSWNNLKITSKWKTDQSKEKEKI
jgi:hypothetical protein